MLAWDLPPAHASERPAILKPPRELPVPDLRILLRLPHAQGSLKERVSLRVLENVSYAFRILAPEPRGPKNQ